MDPALVPLVWPPASWLFSLGLLARELPLVSLHGVRNPFRGHGLG